MADQNTPGTSSTTATTSNQAGGGDAGGEQGSFAAAPKLGASAGGADEADEEAKRSPTQMLKDEAGKFGNQAADRAREFADQGKERATGALDEVASMFRSAADDVDAKLGVEYGRYARSAADGVANFAEGLRGKEVDDLIEGATELVRKSPAVAVGAAAAVGFVLARLIKSGVDAAADLGDRSSTRDTTDA